MSLRARLRGLVRDRKLLDAAYAKQFPGATLARPNFLEFLAAGIPGSRVEGKRLFAADGTCLATYGAGAP